MDFHSLTRRELQSLCKLNKIPANITNLAMADALQSLDIVKGIEEFLNVSNSEMQSDLVESAENIELLSPKAPQTRCRTSTRQKVKKTETENLPPTATRTTRRAAKQLAGGVKDELKTPAVSRTSRKAPSSSSCPNVNDQLNECHQQSLVDQKMESVSSSPVAVVTNSEKNEATDSIIGLKQESTLHEMKTYSRRSTKSFLEEVNVASEEIVESGAQVEDICNAFEKLDVLPVVDEESAHQSEEEIKDFGELGSLKTESEENDITEAENDQVFDVSTLCEEQKLDLEAETFDASEVKDHNLENNGSSTMASDMIIDNIENPIGSLNSDIEINFGDADELTTKETEQVSVNTVDEAFDAIPAVVDNDSTVIEEADADSDGMTQFSVFSVGCLPIEHNNVIGNPTSVTPMKKATPFKNTSFVSNDKENIDSGRNMPIVFMNDGKKSKSDKDESETLMEISLRQLRKQVKALTLKSLNPNEDKEDTATRPALQAICENKMVGGETKN